MEVNDNAERKSSKPLRLFASCHCGAVSQDVQSPTSTPDQCVGTALCHCYTCRHSTGLLCTSYIPIKKPGSLCNTTAHPRCSDQTQRHFCSTCGCHTFRSRRVLEANTLTREGEECWEVATGVLNTVVPNVNIERHINVPDTKDGGVSIWIQDQNGQSLPSSQGFGNDRYHRAVVEPHSITKATLSTLSDNNVLPATCHCTRISFHITRPNPSSFLPRSPFPDLMIPYHTRSSLIPNPQHETWWLRADNTKYLAGTCACRSCRLTSGFEIQTWTFVPRANIVMHLPLRAKGGEGADGGLAEDALGKVDVPLDFATLPHYLLRVYESSPGVIRNFCGTCGATVFWHDKWRPEIIDVSVGLLVAPEGARAEDWLDWWGKRVSFEEDTGREGEEGGRFDLIPGLKRGLVAWHEARRERKGQVVGENEVGRIQQ